MTISHTTKNIPIDSISEKLLQAEAIIHLLSANSRSDVQLTVDYICNSLWAASTLVVDARHLLNSVSNKEESI